MTTERKLPHSALQNIVGGTDPIEAAISRLGTVGSLAGYMFGINIMQTLDLSEGSTLFGTSISALAGAVVTHSIWSNPKHSPGDRLPIGMAFSFVCGAGIGLTEGLLETITET